MGFYGSDNFFPTFEKKINVLKNVTLALHSSAESEYSTTTLSDAYEISRAPPLKIKREVASALEHLFLSLAHINIYSFTHQKYRVKISLQCVHNLSLIHI